MSGDPFVQVPPVHRPARGTRLGFALLAYFVALLLALILVPPLLAADGSTTYADALRQVLLVDLVGYLAGIAPVLR